MWRMCVCVYVFVCVCVCVCLCVSMWRHDSPPPLPLYAGMSMLYGGNRESALAHFKSAAEVIYIYMLR